MQSSTTFRNIELNGVNRTVLRLINHKIYPLNYLKTNQMFKHQRKDKYHTQPNQPTSFPSSSKQAFNNRKQKLVSTKGITMGEYFNNMETKDLIFEGYKNRDYEAINEKINNFVMARRKQIISNDLKKEEEQIESNKSTISHTTHLRKKSANIQQSLMRLRKKIKEQYRRETQILQNQIQGLSEGNQFSKASSIPFNFFQENEGIEKVMDRYPVRQNIRIRMKEDLNKQVEYGIIQEIKNNQFTDKYAKMRMYINHRKMVSLR